MELSYWEYKTWLSNIDFTIVGSGIVGLTTAIFLKKRFPKAKILILEKGILPQGASTKNAGFSCFGSISELLADLKNHSKQEVVALVKQRYKGIQLLREILGDKAIAYQQLGGNELFLKGDKQLFNTCLAAIDAMNTMLKPVFSKDVFETRKNSFGFENIQDQYITQKYEGQIDTGKMMQSLLHLAQNKGVQILNAAQVEAFEEMGTEVVIKTTKFSFKTNKLLVTTNGFASELLTEKVKPARAQVVITKPIPNLVLKGTFHFDEGYYYFRNIDNRILLGGGRNLDFKAEETTNFGNTTLVQKKLKHLLKTVIIPKQNVTIESQWSGIMGVGNHKKPIVKQLSTNVFCGVRLGGMGIAIGSSVGKELADLV